MKRGMTNDSHTNLTIRSGFFSGHALSTMDGKSISIVIRLVTIRRDIRNMRVNWTSTYIWATDKWTVVVAMLPY